MPNPLAFLQSSPEEDQIKSAIMALLRQSASMDTPTSQPSGQMQNGILPQNYQITQAFGNYNPEVEKYSNGINYGTDFGAPTGTKVALPSGNWKVVESSQGGFNKGYGNSVLAENQDTGEKLRFSHLSKVNVAPGQTLQGGSVLGDTGATGNVTGPHLDLEYYNKGGKIGDVTKSNYSRELFGSPQPQGGGNPFADAAQKGVDTLKRAIPQPPQDYSPVKNAVNMAFPITQIPDLFKQFIYNPDTKQVLPESGMRDLTALGQKGQDYLSGKVSKDEYIKSVPQLAPLLAGIMAGPEAVDYPKTGEGTFSSMADKKPRFEINDKGAKLKTKNIGYKQNLGEILDHPQLYENYPELKTIKVTKIASSTSSYNPDTNEIEIGAYADGNKSTLLHEIQHAIQEKEGFARGGSPENVMSLLKNKVNDTSYELGLLKNELEYRKTGRIGHQNYSNLSNADIQSKITNLSNSLDSVKGLDPVTAYQRLSGEVEARDVQSRMNLTPEQRASTLPYQSQGIPVKDQIVRFEGGTSASITPLQNLRNADVASNPISRNIMKQFIDHIENGEQKTNLGQLGKQADDIARMAGIDPTVGNKQLAIYFKKMLQTIPQWQPERVVKPF